MKFCGSGTEKYEHRHLGVSNVKNWKARAFEFLPCALILTVITAGMMYLVKTESVYSHNVCLVKAATTPLYRLPGMNAVGSVKMSLSDAGDCDKEYYIFGTTWFGYCRISETKERKDVKGWINTDDTFVCPDNECIWFSKNSRADAVLIYEDAPGDKVGKPRSRLLNHGRDEFTPLHVMTNRERSDGVPGNEVKVAYFECDRTVSPSRIMPKTGWIRCDNVGTFNFFHIMKRSSLGLALNSGNRNLFKSVTAAREFFNDGRNWNKETGEALVPENL